MIQEKKDVGPMGESPRETQWAAGVVAVLRSAVGLCWERQSAKAPRKACDEGVRQATKLRAGSGQTYYYKPSVPPPEYSPAAAFQPVRGDISVATLPVCSH